MRVDGEMQAKDGVQVLRKSEEILCNVSKKVGRVAQSV